MNAQSPQQVDLFGSRQVQDFEGGFKFASPQFGATLNGFWMLLKNIVGQGAVTDTLTGRTTWIVVTSPENKSYGAELELSALPFKPLRLEANATWLKAELGAGAGADIGSWINGVPPIIANGAATYSVSSFHLMGDWHFVGRRFSDVKAGNVLPQYSYFNFGAGIRCRGAAWESRRTCSTPSSRRASRKETRGWRSSLAAKRATCSSRAHYFRAGSWFRCVTITDTDAARVDGIHAQRATDRSSTITMISWWCRSGRRSLGLRSVTRRPHAPCPSARPEA